MSRLKLTRMFLWFSVISWGIGLGAKVFDLVVLARAWGLDVPSCWSTIPTVGTGL